jgi:hypothetical protein
VTFNEQLKIKILRANTDIDEAVQQLYAGQVFCVSFELDSSSAFRLLALERLDDAAKVIRDRAKFEYDAASRNRGKRGHRKRQANV